MTGGGDLGIFEAEKECVSVGSHQLHTGHGHNIAKEREGGHLLQLLLTGLRICGRKLNDTHTHLSGNH